jgi:4,5-dihydroxyphthalate decarboxylase
MRLTYLPLEAEEAFWRMLRHREFDAAEMSLGAYVSRRARGIEDLVAIPVFPSRLFRHASIFVPAGSPVRDPAELRGGRIGVPEYRMTASIWARGILEEHGLEPGAATWVQGGLEQPGRVSRDAVPPRGVEVVEAPDGRTLSDMLADAEVDALISARRPSSFDNGKARRLFDDPWRLAREFYRRTRIFPIMHTLVLRDDVARAHPWVAQSLLKAFDAAKGLALAELPEESALVTSLPFQPEAMAEVEALMGPDPWANGLADNTHVLESFIDLAQRQGIIDEVLEPAALFAPSTLDPYRI